jgi:hypothetical protein
MGAFFLLLPIIFYHPTYNFSFDRFNFPFVSWKDKSERVAAIATIIILIIVTINVFPFIYIYRKRLWWEHIVIVKNEQLITTVRLKLTAFIVLS